MAKKEDVGQAEVQEKMDEAHAQGFHGSVPDPTPNEHYSLETGPEAPTPETDASLALAAKAPAIKDSLPGELPEQDENEDLVPENDDK